MRLIELRLKNLNSLKGEWHIDFADTAFANEGIFAITGQTGAGKTTILDAICLALYGETPRINSISKSSNEVMTRQTAECFAEVVIDLNGGQYRCRWGQRRAYNKADGNLQDATHEVAKVNIHDASKEDELLESTLKHTKNKIVQLTGMDFQQFTRSILLAQGSFSAFLKAKADERADILEKITGTDIYATISAHVHDKKRTEEEILNKLQYGLDGLSLLDTAAENQLKADLQAHQSAQSTQQQTIKALEEKIKWFDSVAELTAKLHTYQHDLTQAEDAQQAFIPSAKRLAAANKALEMDSQYSQLVSHRDNLQQLQKEQQHINATLPQQQNDLKQATTNLETAQAHLQAANEEWTVTSPNIKEARRLDAEIAQQKYTLQEQSTQQADLSANTQRLCKDIKKFKQSADESKKHLSTIEQQLNEASALNDIDSDIADFKSHCSRLKQRLQDNVALANTHASQHPKTTQYQTSLSRLYQQQQEQDATKATAQDKLMALQQQQTALTQTQSVTVMREEQEQIDHISRQLEQISFKTQQRNELVEQLNKTAAALPNRHDELKKLTSTINSNESALNDAKNQRQNKQNTLYLLQKIAKLEDYIADLKDGAPCPLCGALEHPYSTIHPHLTPQQETEAAQTQRQITTLDAAIADLEQALSELRIKQATKQSQLDAHQQQQTQLNEQIQTLKSDISQLISMALKKTYSKPLAAIIAPLKQMDTQIESVSVLDRLKTALTDRRASLKHTLTHYETLSDDLATIRDTIADIEKEQYRLAGDIKKYEESFSELKKLKDAIVHLLTKYSASSKYYTEAITALRTLQHALHPLTTSIDHQTLLSDADARGHIDTLRQCHSVLSQLKDQLKGYQEKEQTLKAEIGRKETQIETKQEQLKSDEIALSELTQSVTEKIDALEQRQADRTRVFADKNPDDEEQRLREARELTQTAQTAAQRQLDNTEHILNQSLAKQDSVTKEITTAVATLDRQESLFKTALSASDFSDEAEFSAARLPLDERHALNQQQSALNDALKQAQSLLVDTKQTLEAQQARKLTKDDRDTLAQQQAQAQDESTKRIESIGAISQQLRDNENKKRTQQTQIDAINAQKDKLQVWQQLHKLIGSSDGKKYRTFAQGLTFDLMVTHANTQLQKMSDRYLLAHDDNSPLELTVIDNYQGGEIRSTKNLSGGEGFIISLALALGLSQMASQNIRVDSLFLDEGFGTLDEESLDIALETLTGLQQEGKLIGVISHVAALKERILTQIQVNKLSGGFSEITGQGCYRL